MEPGAPAEAGTIPLCIPHLAGNEWEYIRECLDTNFVSSVGPFVDRFERMLAERVGVPYAVATVNGTSALHVALRVAGVEPDDEVLVSTLTFIAPANAVRYVGAWPIPIDVGAAYWQMDPERVRGFLGDECEWHNGVLRNRATGRRVRAIIPVHILGHPVDMAPLVELAREYGLAVIEDATESLGAEYRSVPVGQLGDIACFSFNGNKLITTGGGGMIVTGREDWARRARYLTTQAKDDPLEYIHQEIGFNYRLTNVLAALGCAQLEQLDSFLNAKRAIAERYDAALAEIPGLTPQGEAHWAHSAFWLYTVRVDAVAFGMGSRQLLRGLSEGGIQTRPLWQPLHRSPAHRSWAERSCPVADAIHAEALSLPCSVGLQPAEQARVIDALSAASTAA